MGSKHSFTARPSMDRTPRSAHGGTGTSCTVCRSGPLGTWWCKAREWKCGPRTSTTPRPPSVGWEVLRRYETITARRLPFVMVQSQSLLDGESVDPAVPASSTRPIPRPARPGSVPTCPACEASMRRRSGRYGDFWGCSRYPSCKGTRQR
ncbi:MAG: topoisomerase DNA-binding C4 zinc finger domain-containing protein [Chloroflexi bacterium]|nr:topoisomerase DNA-binding C4 zinc finger domain-containing protein [Chloroflexota bacterium]